MADLVAGDGGTTLRVTVRNAATGEAMDLSGRTVTLRYRLNGGDLIAKFMDVLDQAVLTGKAQYQFDANDIPHAGVMHYEVQIDHGTLNQLTSIDVQQLTVRSVL